MRAPSTLMMLLLLLLLPALAAESAAQTPEQLIESGAVRIRTRLQPVEGILVGEKMTLYVEVLTSTWFPQPVRFPDSIESASAVAIASKSGSSISDRIDGASFAGVSRRYDFYPFAPGPFSTPPVEVTVVVALDNAQPSPEITLTVPPRTLEVHLPAEAAGLGLVIASPSLEVEETFAPETEAVRVGDAIERSVRLTVQDSVSMLLPRIDLTGPEGVATYAEAPRQKDTDDRGRVSGERLDRVTYVFERQGTFVLPAVELHWWDSSSGRLRTESLAAREVIVAPNPDLAAEHFATAEDEMAAVEPADEAPSGWNWRELFVVAGALLVVVLIGRRLASAWKTREHSESVSLQRAETDAFREFQHASSGGDAAATYSGLMAWLGVFGPRHQISTLADLSAGRPELAAEISRLETALYGRDSGVPSWNGTRLRHEVEQIREELIPDRHRRSPTARDLPMALNP